ncbi:hypothetical protein NON20_15105 [Synechocystis sp. B12]|nr:hypothetical protein NON20_15105 [Synechocystis sp. B12]
MSEYNLIFLMVKGENASARPVFQTSASSKETVPPVVSGRSPRAQPQPLPSIIPRRKNFLPLKRVYGEPRKTLIVGNMRRPLPN